MKTFLVLSTFFIFCSSFAQDTYSVSGIDPASARFQNILAAVRSAEATRAHNTLATTLETIQHLEGTLYLAFLTPSARGFSREVSALTGFSQIPASREIVAVERKEGSPVAADGEMLVIRLEPAGTHQYTAITGAKKTVKLYREIDTSRQLTAEEFLTRLKAGETWTITTKSPGQRPKQLQIAW